MDIAVEEITPQVATEYLKLVDEKQQRKTQVTHVDYLVRLMKANEFQETGQTIQISETNRLLDGQHRLHAIVRSGKTYKFVVVKNLPDTVFTALDRGKSRTAGDMLHMAGLSHGSTRARLARLIIAFRNRFAIGQKGSVHTDYAEMTPDRLIAFNRENDLTPHLEFAEKTTAVMGSKFLNKSEWAFLSFIFTEKDPVAAQVFLQNLAIGHGLTADSHILSLRNRLIGFLSKRKTVTYAEKMSMVVRAWNHFRTGRAPGRINVSESKYIPEPV